MTVSMTLSASVCALLVLSSPAGAQNGGRHEDTLTFTAPVQLPGVVLPAGSYVFEQVDEAAGPSRVRVSGLRPLKLIAQFRTVPLQRLDGSNAVTFRAAEAGIAPAISAWFVQKGKLGQEFIYTERQQRALGATPAGSLAPIVK
jgi:hypothetical protein